METINVWIDKGAFEALKSDEPYGAVIQNRLDLSIPFTKPRENMISCELVVMASLKKPEPLGDKRLILDIEDMKNFTSRDRAKVEEAKKIYNIVVNHPLYWEKIKKNWEKITEKKGYSLDQFRKMYMAGDCNFTEADNETDVKLIMYNNIFSKVVGYVYSNQDNLIHINKKYFSSPLKIASNLNHEALHLLGFNHYGVKATSIPYFIGNKLFEETWIELSKAAA